jgi:2-oxoglutarate dehydrogenase E1 component
MRWLASAAEGNMRIAMPSTAAQLFHLLRRQALHEVRRPLIVMTPKGLLKAPWAMSPLEDFTNGRFEWVMDDPAIVEADSHDEVTRLVLCAGKVYHDMAQHPERAAATNTALARIELLYPFPRKQVADLFAAYPNLREVIWAQEEPLNFGAYPHLQPRISKLLPDTVTWSYAGRPKRASASEGYTSVHNLGQERLVRAALGLDAGVVAHA